MKRSVNDIFIDDVSAYKGKRVLVRLDWNVATDENGNPTETERITRTFTLLENLSQTGAITVVMSHLGEKGASLMPIINFVKEKLPFVTAVAGHDFDEIHKVVEAAALRGEFLGLRPQAKGEGSKLCFQHLDFSKPWRMRLRFLWTIRLGSRFPFHFGKARSISPNPRDWWWQRQLRLTFC
jgi:hypothetical protein